MYYLIEEVIKKSYDPRDQCEYLCSTDYFVIKCKSKDELKKKFIEGPKCGGKLLPVKGLEFRLQIIEEEERKEPYRHGSLRGTGQVYSSGGEYGPNHR